MPDGADEVEDGVVVWGVEATSSTLPQTERIVIGELPRGYRELVSLDGSLVADRLYTVRLTSGQTIQHTFLLDEDVATDRVLYGGQPVTESEFTESTACDDGG